MPKNETFLFAEPESKPTKKETQEISPAQKLLDWLQRWGKPTVCVGDIRVWGPASLRTREKAISAATVLVGGGWLTPVWQRRYDAHVWRIVRKPIVQPKVFDLNR